jgi:hypothetical protein
MVYIKRVSSKKSRPAKKAGLQKKSRPAKKKARYENKSCERACLSALNF